MSSTAFSPTMSAAPAPVYATVPSPAAMESSADTALPNTSDVPSFTSFDDMELKDEILRGIYTMGFQTPSPIQQKAIVPMTKRRDIIAQAQSGTGKTATFSIGSIQQIDPGLKAPQVLVLAPTRELAQQSQVTASGIGQYLGIQVLCATGGPPIAEDMRALQRGAQFIVGTPGRIYDLIRRGALKLDNIRVLIMDEADQMLEDRFREQVLCILEFKFPASTRIAFFSATMPPEVTEVAERFLDDPCRILIPPESVTLDGIKQFYVPLDQESHKFEVLLDILRNMSIAQLIIFVNKRQKAEWLTAAMQDNNFTIECIHGEMDVAERKKRMGDFRSGRARILIATDLLARGIDVQQVSTVINYELPLQRENYIHRIGRSGRYGRKGVAINLIVEEEQRSLDDIETYYKTKINTLPDDLDSLSPGRL